VTATSAVPLREPERLGVEPRWAVRRIGYHEFRRSAIDFNGRPMYDGRSPVCHCGGDANSEYRDCRPLLRPGL